MRLFAYVGGKVGSTLLVALPALAGLIALLQTMRLLPLVGGAGMTAAEAAQLAGLLVVMLLSSCLPVAAVIAVVIGFSRLDGDGELLALRAAGAGSMTLAAAPALLCLAVAGAAGASALVAEPAAHRALRSLLGELTRRAAIGSLRPGVLVEPAPGLTLLVRERQGSVLTGLFMEDRREDPPTQVFAARAVLRSGGLGETTLEMESGAVHVGSPRGTFTRTRFERLEAPLRLDRSIGALGELLPARLAAGPKELALLARRSGTEGRRAGLLLHHRLAIAPSALALGLLAILFALSLDLGRRPLGLLIAAGAILAFHVAIRLCEAGVETGAMGPLLAAWTPTVGALGLAAAWAAREGQRGR